MRIASGRTDAQLTFVAVDSTDLKTRKTGLTSFTVYRSRNGGTATVYTTPTITELSAANMPGVYTLLIDEDTTITSGVDEEEYTVHITQASMAPVTRAVELFRPKGTEGRTLDVSTGGEAGLDWANIGSPTTSVNLSGTSIGTAANVTTVNGLAANVITATSINADAITAAKIADGAIDAATFAAGAINAAAIATGAITNAKFAAGAIDAAAIADAAIDAATFAASAITSTVLATGAITAAKFAAGAIDAAAIATGAIDADALAADASTEIRSLASGTSDSGSTTTMVDAARTEADTDYWKGQAIVFTSGNIIGQARLITGFNAATDTITFAPATTQAVSTQTYEIWPANRVDLHMVNGVATTATLDTLQADTDDIQTRLPAALISGRIDASVGAMAANVLTATAINADAITAAKVAADVSSEIADQVWDEVLSGHLTAGTTGNALNAAGSAGDPWSTVLPGAYGAGTAGKIIGDNINATISSRATQTSVDAIQADTDNIQTRLPTALISGRMDSSVGAMAANVLTASAINADAITAAKVAADVGSEIALAVWGADTGDINIPGTAGATLNNTGPTAAAIADAVWDELLSGHTTTGSAGKGLSDAGSAGDPWATALPGAYSAGSAGFLIGTNLNATVSSRATQTSLDAVQADTDDIQTRIPAALVSGRMDSSVGAMAANVLTASALATDAANEIAGVTALAVWGADTGDINLPGTAGATLNNTGPTAAAIADAVWDELLAGHAIAGSAGAGLTAAGTAGDPWSTPLPGVYSAGSAGAILGDLDNSTAAIKAKTDLLPAAPAAVSDIPTASAVAAATLSAASAAPIASDLKSIKTVPLTGTGPFGI